MFRLIAVRRATVAILAVLAGTFLMASSLFTLPYINLLTWYGGGYFVVAGLLLRYSEYPIQRLLLLFLLLSPFIALLLFWTLLFIGAGFLDVSQSAPSWLQQK
jgi:hypothetical protein